MMGLENHEMCLDTVSTTRDSGWVHAQLWPSASTTYPPATAGGTDCVQVGPAICAF